jgi:hypothetical protein
MRIRIAKELVCPGSDSPFNPPHAANSLIFTNGFADWKAT